MGRSRHHRGPDDHLSANPRPEEIIWLAMNMELSRIKILLRNALLFPRASLASIFPETWKVFHDREKRDPDAAGWGSLIWLIIIAGLVAYAVVHTAMNGPPLSAFYP